MKSTIILSHLSRIFIFCFIFRYVQFTSLALVKLQIIIITEIFFNPFYGFIYETGTGNVVNLNLQKFPDSV